MLLANFNGKEHLRHRAVSLRQHFFLVVVYDGRVVVTADNTVVCAETVMNPLEMYAGVDSATDDDDDQLRFLLTLRSLN